MRDFEAGWEGAGMISPRQEAASPDYRIWEYATPTRVANRCWSRPKPMLGSTSSKREPARFPPPPYLAWQFCDR